MKFLLLHIILAAASVASAIAVPSTVADTNIEKRGWGAACLLKCASVSGNVAEYAACLAACTAQGVPDGAVTVDE
ncbi:uncharacterized protein LY89DRAFT_691640 [Mollisia scopiformis]|uniref:Uncharacterized protein n=1 Tax=Mollisia scopiformis TaxID=149040 RepID=A0A132B564_MOLSC|nr:uncharacterized protein LY89DRAFT_691640 [Mollisia scopiformis]KUJ07550.1 hypothetical protein LY89DRAFT_691640 [Mollisia scopiformis]